MNVNQTYAEIRYQMFTNFAIEKKIDVLSFIS